MSWSLVVFLGMAMVSLLLLMGFIIFGTKKSNEMKTLEKTFGKQSEDVKDYIKQLQSELKESKAEKQNILARLKNLEAIVTSEAYEAIKSGEESSTIGLHLENEEVEELDDAQKAANIAKRVR